jgi:hypothetical protein
MWFSECDRIFIASRGFFGRSKRSFPARRLRFRVVWIGFVRFVVTDQATCRRTQLSMSGHAARHATDNGPFDTSLSVGASDRGHQECCCASRRKQPFHIVLRLPKSEEQCGSGKTVPTRACFL